MKEKNKTATILVHIASCIAFLILPFIFAPRSSFLDSNFIFGHPEIRSLISSVLLIGFFYASYYYLLPELFVKKKYGYWGLLTFLFFLIIIILPQVLVQSQHQQFPDAHPPFSGMNEPPHWGPPMHDDQFHFFKNFMFQDSALKFLIVLAFAFILRTGQLWKKAAAEKRLAELSYLKSQVNPHFLFNTLNGIYSLALIHPNETPDAILKLSQLMRYMLQELEHDYVPIQKEISFVKDFVDLQKLRLGETIRIRLNDENADVNLMIAPLLLIPFVEYAFKVADITDNNLIDIKISADSAEKSFLFRINTQTNNTFNESDCEKELKNVKKRITLLYPQKNSLFISKDKDNYSVELKLTLKNDSYSHR